MIREIGRPGRLVALVGFLFACMYSAGPAAAQSGSFFPSFSGSSEPATQQEPTAPPPVPDNLGGFPTAAPPVGAAAPAAAAYYSGYRLAPQDLLNISIWEAPEFTRAVRVAPDGTIRLPLLKAPIVAGGLTALEAEQHISQALVDGGLLVDPIVAVTVVEFHGNPVRVSGAVRNPVVVQAIGPTTLLSAITQAGGIDMAHAGPEIVIEKPGSESVRFLTKEFTEGVNGVEDYPLAGGERVRVEPAGTVVVFGAVTRAGEFTVPDEGGMEFLELFSRAGGAQPDAGGKAILLRPSAAGSGRDRIEISLKKVLKSEAGDLRVHAGDVVYVPHSRLKKFAERFAEAAAFQALLRLIIF